jgi:hypothetical protein
MISQEMRERAESRARIYLSRKNKQPVAWEDLRAHWGEELLKALDENLALKYALGAKLEKLLRQQGEDAWEQYLETEEISREEAETHMHFAAAVDAGRLKPAFKH